MNSDWSYPLDMCAASGLLDYDAAADILGQKQRFVGNPKMTEIASMSPIYLPEGTTLQEQPKFDNFEFSEDEHAPLVQPKSWKKWAMGGLALLGLGACAFALIKGKKPNLPNSNGTKSKFKLPKFDLSKIKASVKNGAKTVWKYIKMPFSYIKNLVKKKP